MAIGPSHWGHIEALRDARNAHASAVRGHKHASEYRRLAVQEARKFGLTTVEIAEVLGISQSAVVQITRPQRNRKATRR